MDAIEALTQRTSHPKVLDEPPTSEQLEIMLKAAGRAADHARLRPYRFIGISGDARLKFGQLMVEGQRESSGEVADPDALAAKALRAPLIIAVVCSPTEHPKVPEIEQMMSAACAAQMMLAAAHAQGLGAMWRSGSLMFTEAMAQGLGLAEHESLVGFLYVGQAMRDPVKPAEFDMAEKWTDYA